MNLQGKRVLITGVGVKPAKFVFKDITTGEPSHTPIFDGDTEYKANIGAAIAFECAKVGAVVHLVSRTEEKLRIIKSWIEKEIPEAKVEYSAIDLSDVEQLRKLEKDLPKNIPLYWVQSVGLGAGTVKIKDDNPYLTIENISPELVEAETTVLKDTISVLQTFLPRFKEQEETRIVIVTSMSAIRSLPGGSIHNAAKGAISRFANASMIELGKNKIFITDVRPGGVDTGMYDAKAVQESIEPMAVSYGYDWSEKNGGLRLAPPSSVGMVVVSILSSDAHITSLNLVARGQWPHEGS